MNRVSVQRDDTGASLIIAVVVMMVLTTLATALLARTLSVMATIRLGQDFDGALAVADAGLSDALFYIDQTAPNDFTGTDKDPLDPSDPQFFEYIADKQSDTEYLITSVGNLGRSRHAIQAVVRRGAQFPYALWSTQPLHFDGTTETAMRIQFYAFNRLPGDPDIVRIGSNDHIVCNGPIDDHVHIDEYGGNSDCESDHITKLEEPRDLSFSVPPGPTQPCPAGGIFGLIATTDTTPAYIDGSGGPFVCRENVTLLGHIAVQNGPVQIYVLPTLDASGNVLVEHSLDMSAAVVNVAQGASQFQLYKSGNAPINIGSGNTSSTMTFRGVLWAPESRLAINGGLWWTGSINVNELVVNGSPNLLFGYDYDLYDYLGKDWRVKRYREMPAAPAAAVISGSTSTTTTSTTSTTTTTTTTTLLGL